MSEAKVPNKDSGEKPYCYFDILQEERGGKANLRLFCPESGRTRASSP